MFREVGNIFSKNRRQILIRGIVVDEIEKWTELMMNAMDATTFSIFRRKNCVIKGAGKYLWGR